MNYANSDNKRKSKKEQTQDAILKTLLNTYSNRLMTKAKKIQLQNKNHTDSIYKKDMKGYQFIVYNEKDKPSQNDASKENKKKDRNLDNIENLKFSQESKWNKVILSKPLRSSSMMHKNLPPVQAVTNTKQIQNLGNSKPKSETSRPHLVAVQGTPKQRLTNAGLAQLSNELTEKSFTPSTYSLSDINDLGSLGNTPDLYMQVEQAICEGRNGEQSNLMQAGVNQLKPSNSIADTSANPGRSTLRDKYLDLPELSSMPECQEILDWIKNSDSEESFIHRIDNLHDEFSRIKLKQALKKIKNQNKIMELKFGKNLQVQNRKGEAQEKCAISPNVLPQNADSQELKLLNNELANYLSVRMKNIKDTSLVNPEEEAGPQENIKQIANANDNNTAKFDNALFEPPKKHSSSSEVQECAIEHLTNRSIRKSLRLKARNLNDQEKELPSHECKRPRKPKKL